MVLAQCCISWITHFWVRLVASVGTVGKGHPAKALPDDIIIDILSRLPAKNVSLCRNVCKKWYELTSTNDFAHTHLQRNSNGPDRVLIFQCSYKYYTRESYHHLFTLNKEARGIKMLKEIFTDFNATIGDFPILYGSYNGLLMFTPRSPRDKGYILNPTTCEHINIRCNEGYVCGLFFHQLRKEYGLLCYSSKKSEGGLFDFFLFTLETESLRKIGSFPYYPISSPVSFDGALHWIINSNCNTTCENSLMVFNVEGENLNSFPHPGNQCLPPACNRKDMCLFENADELCFCRTLEDCIDIWVLEINKNRVWIKRYVVHLDWDLRIYPFNEIRQGSEMQDSKLRVLNIENRELLIFWKKRGLFVYNLKKNNVKKVDLRGLNSGMKLVSILRATSYVKSLVSLKVPWKYPHYGKFPTFGQVIIDLATENPT